MIKFFLESELDNSRYEFDINLTIEEMEDYYESPEYQKKMEEMECGTEPWCGVHDVTGGLDEWGYSSYEIQDFPAAIEQWRNFFRQEGLLVEIIK